MKQFELNKFVIIPAWKLLVVCLVLFCSKTTLSQVEHNFSPELKEAFTIENLSDKLDMPQTIIESIFMDSAGFLWMTNYTGSILRYDGRKIRNYQKRRDIEDITIWKGTDGSSLVYAFNWEEEVYELIVPSYKLRKEAYTLATISNGEIVPKKESIKQTTFVRCSSWGANRYIFQDNDSIRSMLGLSKFSDSAISRICCYTINEFEAYLSRFPGDGPQSMRYVSVNPEDKSSYVIAASVSNNNLVRTHKSSLLILDIRLGIFEFNEGKLIRRYPISEITGTLDSSYFKDPMFVNALNFKETVVLVGNSLIHVSGDLGDLQFNTLLEGVNIAGIRGVAFSKSKNDFFISAGSQGVIHLKRKQFRNSFQKSKVNQSYYSTVEHGEHLFVNLRERYSLNDFESIENADEDIIQNGVSDSGHSVYFERDNKIFKLDTLSNSWNQVTEVRGQVDFGEKILLGVDSNDNLYYAVGDSFVNVTQHKSFHLPGTIDVDFLCMVFKPNSEVWLGTSNGVYAVNIETGLVDFIESTRNLTIRDIYLFNGTTDMLATYGRGLCFLKQKSILETPKNGFSQGSLFQHRIIKDELSTFWVSTNNGLLRYSEDGINRFLNGTSKFLGYQYFDKKDGFASNEFNGGKSNCGVTTSNGIIVLPSQQGLVYFDPLKVAMEEVARNIIIEAFINDTEFDEGSKLDGKVGRITFKISSPNYSNVNNLQLWYRLHGESDQWRPVPKNGEVSFTNLKSGIKILEVDRILMSREDLTDTFKFVVPKKYYETWWFRLFVLLCIAGMAYGISRARIAYLENTALILQERIEKQYEVLISQNSQLEDYVYRLEKSEESLSKQKNLREKLIEIISHDAMGSLNFIRYISQELDVKRNQLSKGDRDGYIENLHAATDSIYETMHRILSWIKTQREELIIHKDLVLIGKLIEELQEYFALPITVNKVQLIPEINGELQVATDKELLASILRNLLENEVKHNQGVSVFIKAYQQADKVIIHIRNPSTPLANIESINQLFESDTNEDHKTLGMKGGLGLLLIKELTLTIQARIYYASLGKEGHQIYLELPSNEL